MMQFYAFLKKEWMEQIRSHRFYVLLVIFLLFGIMNPALAKLTPWLFSLMSEEMAKQGILIAEMHVDALTSWMQYYKNITMVILLIVIMLCPILTNEYQKGTLINMVTKGLERWKIVLAKGLIMLLIWSLCYWLCFAVTYAYTAYFWDNQIAHHIVFAAACIWLFGIWMIATILCFSTIFQTSILVLVGIAGLLGVCYLCALVPAWSSFLPTQLLSALSLLSQEMTVSSFLKSGLVTSILIVGESIAAIMLFNKKML